MEILLTTLFFVALFVSLKVIKPKSNSDKRLDKLQKYYNGTK